MSDLDKLSQLDIKEIQKVTKLTHSRINDIVRKRFSNIERVRAVGFLNIIEREFKLNLDEWLVEYDKYHSSLNEQPAREKEGNKSGAESSWLSQTWLAVSSKYRLNDTGYMDRNLIKSSHHYGSNQDKSPYSYDIEILKKNNRGFRILTAISIACLVLLVVGYIAYEFLSNDLNSKNRYRTATSSGARNLEETSDVIGKLDSTNNVSSKLEKSLADDSHNEFGETTISESAVKENELVKIESNNKLQKVALINPHERLWFSITDISTKKMLKDYTIDSAYSLNVDRDVVVKFGHSNFSIEMDGKSTMSSSPRISYYIFSSQDGFRKISYREYKAATEEIN